MTQQTYLPRNREIRYDGGMSKIARKDILNLSVAERIELIGDLWDSMAEAPEAIELTEAQKAELDRRLDAHRKDPTAGAPGPSSATESRNADNLSSTALRLTFTSTNIPFAFSPVCLYNKNHDRRPL